MRGRPIINWSLCRVLGCMPAPEYRWYTAKGPKGHNALTQESNITPIIFVHTTYVVRGIGLGHFRYSFYMPLRWSVHAFIYCLCVCPDTWLQTKLTQHFQVLTFGYFDTHALCQSAHWLSTNLHHEQFYVVDARSSCLSNEPWYCCTLCLSVGRSGKKLCASLIRHGWNSILWIMSLVSIYLQRCSLC